MAAFPFHITAVDGAARTGVLRTSRGDVRTPAWMPVGTAGTVKALTPGQVREAGADIILGNTYHLMLRPFTGETAIFITPGYRFRAADARMTNFHLPKSTLFMLVSAFAGLERMHAAYRHAVAQGYRFYSYGDASLLWRAPAASGAAAAPTT